MPSKPQVGLGSNFNSSNFNYNIRKITNNGNILTAAILKWEAKFHFILNVNFYKTHLCLSLKNNFQTIARLIFSLCNGSIKNTFFSLAVISQVFCLLVNCTWKYYSFSQCNSFYPCPSKLTQL